MHVLHPPPQAGDETCGEAETGPFAPRGKPPDSRLGERTATPAAANANVHKLEEAGVLVEITGNARNMVFAAQGVFSLVHDSTDDTPANP